MSVKRHKTATFRLHLRVTSGRGEWGRKNESKVGSKRMVRSGVVGLHGAVRVVKSAPRTQGGLQQNLLKHECKPGAHRVG